MTTVPAFRQQRVVVQARESLMMTAERSAAFDIVDAIMKEREGGALRTRREWEQFVEGAIGGVVDEAVADREPEWGDA